MTIILFLRIPKVGNRVLLGYVMVMFRSKSIDS